MEACKLQNGIQLLCFLLTNRKKSLVIGKRKEKKRKSLSKNRWFTFLFFVTKSSTFFCVLSHFVRNEFIVLYSFFPQTIAT
jgi:hypothetical protein